MKTSLAFTPGTGTRLYWAMAAAFLASACGGSNAPPPQPPGPYYNLIPGLCAEYAPDGGEATPYIGVRIQTSTTPPGIELQRTRHGVMDENDFVSFAPDGGGVFLIEREYSGTASISVEDYSTPLAYLPAPPLAGQTTLDSSSACMSGSVCNSMSLDVSVASTDTYTGVYGDGGQTESHINYTYQYDGDGGESLVESALVPGIGFTQLYLPDSTGKSYVWYFLVDIVTYDGGNCANH